MVPNTEESLAAVADVCRQVRLGCVAAATGNVWLTQAWKFDRLAWGGCWRSHLDLPSDPAGLAPHSATAAAAAAHAQAMDIWLAFSEAAEGDSAGEEGPAAEARRRRDAGLRQLLLEVSGGGEC